MIKAIIKCPREVILQQALSLTPEARVLVIVALEESLVPPESDVSNELLEELDRRVAEYEAGAAAFQTHAEFVDSLRRRQSEQQ